MPNRRDLPEEPTYPVQVNSKNKNQNSNFKIILKTISKEREIKLNYMFLKKQLNQTPIVPMQAESINNIFYLVRDCYRDDKNMNRVKNEFIEETKKMYYEAMHKSVAQNFLIVPKVKGLENENLGSPPKEPE